MLKISKNQVVKGQRVIVDYFDLIEEEKMRIKSDIYTARYMVAHEFNKIHLKPLDVLILDGLSDSFVSFHKEGETTLYKEYWTWFKTITHLEDDSDNLGKDKVEYVLFYDGKKYKPKKYSDIGKIKASLLIEMGYHDIFEQCAKQYLDNCPEHEDIETPYWYQVGANKCRSDFAKFEIYEWSNRKLGNKVDFDPVAFYDEQLFYIKISSKFGSAARELFKKLKPEHKYMFVFMHEDYGTKYIFYKDLKESNIIKQVLSDLKIKTVKSTKMGKTAIALDSPGVINKIVNNLPKDSRYLILDIEGNELELIDNDLFVAIERNNRLESLGL